MLRAALILPPCWLGNNPEGQQKQRDHIIQKLKLKNIFSFQVPLPHLPSSKVFFFLHHVTVSCKGTIELVKISFLGKKYCSNTTPYFSYNTRSQTPTPGKKKDQFRSLGNCPATPPLSHHFAQSEK